MQPIINVPESFNWHRNRIYVQRVIGTYLEPGMRFLDIGSNMGYFSYFAANVMAGEGEVHAFEPVEHLTESMRSKVDRSARENEPDDIRNCSIIQVHHLATWDEAIKLDFNQQFYNNGQHSSAMRPVNKGGGYKTIFVDADRIDNMFDTFDIAKVNVNGAEWRTLLGMEDAVKTQERLIIIVSVHDRGKGNIYEIGRNLGSRFNLQKHTPDHSKGKNFGTVILSRGYNPSEFHSTMMLRHPDQIGG